MRGSLLIKPLPKISSLVNFNISIGQATLDQSPPPRVFLGLPSLVFKAKVVLEQPKLVSVLNEL